VQLLLAQLRHEQQHKLLPLLAMIFQSVALRVTGSPPKRITVTIITYPKPCLHPINLTTRNSTAWQSIDKLASVRTSFQYPFWSLLPTRVYLTHPLPRSKSRGPWISCVDVIFVEDADVTIGVRELHHLLWRALEP
jgi:hypothetical protein